MSCCKRKVSKKCCPPVKHAPMYKPISDKLIKDVCQLSRTVNQKVFDIDDNIDEIEENTELIEQNKQTIQLHTQQINNIETDRVISSMALNMFGFGILSVVSGVVTPINVLAFLEAKGDFLPGDLMAATSVRIPSDGIYQIDAVIQWIDENTLGSRTIIINAGSTTFQASFVPH